MSWTNNQKIEYAREYYKKNRQNILEKKRIRDVDPNVAKKQKEHLNLPEVRRHRKEYTRSKRRDPEYAKAERQKAIEKMRRRRNLINLIQLHYECQNPECDWTGDYLPGLLDFHHLYPEIKYKQIALMLNYKLERIAQEVNKCVVLCRNCHAKCHLGLVKLDESMLCKVNEKLEVII